MTELELILGFWVTDHFYAEGKAMNKKNPPYGGGRSVSNIVRVKNSANIKLRQESNDTECVARQLAML